MHASPAQSSYEELDDYAELSQRAVSGAREAKGVATGPPHTATECADPPALWPVAILSALASTAPRSSAWRLSAASCSCSRSQALVVALVAVAVVVAVVGPKHFRYCA